MSCSVVDIACAVTDVSNDQAPDQPGRFSALTSGPAKTGGADAYYARLDARFGEYGAAFRREGNDYRALYRIVRYLLTNSAYLTWEVILSFQFTERAPFPSLKTIADKRGVSERAIQLNIQYLEAKGLLWRVPIIRNGRFAMEFHFEPLYALAYDYLQFEQSDGFLDWRGMKHQHAELVPPELRRFLIYEKIVCSRPRGRKSHGRFGPPDAGTCPEISALGQEEEPSLHDCNMSADSYDIVSSKGGSAMADHMMPEPTVGSTDPIGNADVRVDGPTEDSDFCDGAGLAEDTPLSEAIGTIGAADLAEDTLPPDVGAGAGNPGFVGNFGPVHPSVNERSRRRACHLREIYRAQLACERESAASMSQHAAGYVQGEMPLHDAGDAGWHCDLPLQTGRVAEHASDYDARDARDAQSSQYAKPAHPPHSHAGKRSKNPLQRPTSRRAAGRYEDDEESSCPPVPSPLPSLVRDVLDEISLTFNDEFFRSSQTRAARLYVVYVQGVNQVNDAYSVKDPAQAFAAILTALFNRLRNHRFLRKTSQGLPNGMPLFFTELEQQVRDICKRVAYHRRQEAVQRFQSAHSQAQARVRRQSSTPSSYAALPEYEMPDPDATPVDYTEPEPYTDYAQSYDDPFDDGPAPVEGQIVMSPAQQRTADDPPCPHVRFSVREMSEWYATQYRANLTIGELIRLGQHYGANLTEAQVAAICATPADDALISFTIETIRISTYYDMLDNFVKKGLA
jgi:hypothetical protein